MLRDVYWRQYPVDLLSDDKMACVEAMLPDEYKHVPYMIYIAALKLCDDNGVFDLDDGVVLARLTRVKDVSVIFNVINLMRQRKILYRVFDNAMLCGLVDWTYSDKKPRTIEERRKLVAERIQKEQSRAGVDKDFTVPGENTQKQQLREAGTEPQSAAFLCPQNDKNAENVVKSGMDDKNAKNVVTIQYNTVQDNNTVHTDIQDIHTNTHTQQQVPGYGPIVGPPPETCQNKADVAAKKNEIQSINTENANTPTDANADGAGDLLLQELEALREQTTGEEENDRGGLLVYLNDFFVKNCYGYKANQSGNAVNTLAEKILELSDAVNPPETIAGLLCSEFKKMCEGQRESYWKGMPLLPANMVKPRAWAELVQYAGKILATAGNSNKFMQSAKKAQEECEAEKDIVDDAIRNEFIKYNISPEDPNRHQKLLVAKSNANKAVKEAEDTEDYAIF